MTVPNAQHEATVELEDSLEEVQAYFEVRGWSDGLPFIPPTRERVARLIGHLGRDADEVVCSLAPRNGEATVERVAANAVMAGCRPEDFPIVVTAVEAVAAPELNLNAMQSTTHPTAIMILVNGPVADKLGINSGPGCLGPGWRANMAIGRAMRLVLLNIGGGSPGDGDRATQGSPAKIGFCLAENQLESPWEPYHVEHGFGRDDSVVTVIACEGPHNIQDHFSISGSGVLATVAGALGQAGSNNIMFSTGFPVVAFGPEHAHQVAVSGYSKADVKRFLWEHGRFPLHRLSAEWLEDGRVAARVESITGSADAVPITSKPENIQVIVAGGPGKHSCWMPTFGGDTRPVMRKLER
ncbi:MAG: hypothetical protein GEV08_23845 [Acidimicrobiia bacterium]|nr:hypothetical protein [Acidimicrobiia bacterium]